MLYADFVKANYILKHNIDTILRARGQQRKDLAQFCHNTESWLSKIFSNEKRGIPLKYLDRIAEFFGIATHELLQPGIDTLTERRKRERRSGQERRQRRAFASVTAPTAAALLVKIGLLTADERKRVEASVDMLLDTQGVLPRTGGFAAPRVASGGTTRSTGPAPPKTGAKPKRETRRPTTADETTP